MTPFSNRSNQSPSPIQRIISPLSSGIVSPVPPAQALSPSNLSGDRNFSFKTAITELEVSRRLRLEIDS